MKPIGELRFGYNDAENYKRRENKELFNRLFIRTRALDRLISPETFFLIGEKGTGKTAYSVFLENSDYHNTRAKTCYIRETEYQSFVSLKQDRQLPLSDYSSIWKVILLVLLAKAIEDKDLKGGLISRYSKLELMRDAIDRYYNHAFSPEIVNVLTLVKDSSSAAEIFSDFSKLGAASKESFQFTESKFQTNLLFIEATLREAILQLRMSRNLILFIDGIDLRPKSIPFKEYHDCIRGLANAIWTLNNDIFPALKDSAGRIKIVLLVRPDIFASLALQNQNTKLRDNSVLLDWRTTYRDCRYSELFRLADRVLSSDQEASLREGHSWDHYFPYKIASKADKDEFEEDHSDSSFISFLRFSFYRPRDIITMLSILQDMFIEHGRGKHEVFSQADFNNREFRNRYSSYVLGEIKDHLSFYYSDEDYEVFLRFFTFLGGAYKFTYEQFVGAYDNFLKSCRDNSHGLPSFFETADIFLQFLYDLNIIFYIEFDGDRKLINLCLRERSYSNISPKVKTHTVYEVHYGVGKALNLGNGAVTNNRRQRE